MIVRSLLFVPGNRSDRFDKAVAAGADCVCIDLEDAVPPDGKSGARADVLAWLAARDTGAGKVGVRINQLATLDGMKDVVAFAEAGSQAGFAMPDFIMVPKASSAALLDALLGALSYNRFSDHRVRLWPVLETVAGVRAADELAGFAVGGGLLFGGADYAAELGVAMEWEPLFHARANLVEAASLIPDVNLLDVPWLDVGDQAGLRAECERVKALGFKGKACIHPAQVAIVNEVFSPSASQIAWARRVVEAGEAAGGNAILLDGKLLDTPVYLRAFQLLKSVE